MQGRGNFPDFPQGEKELQGSERVDKLIFHECLLLFSEYGDRRIQLTSEKLFNLRQN